MSSTSTGGRIRPFASLMCVRSCGDSDWMRRCENSMRRRLQRAVLGAAAHLGAENRRRAAW
jgi:hypothetical protein